MSIAKWRSIVAIVLIFSLLGATTGLAAGGDAFDSRPVVEESEPSGGEMLLDVVLVRPISFLGMIIGCVGWLGAAPLALIADGSEGFETVSKKMVIAPVMYTFNRTVGEF